MNSGWTQTRIILDGFFDLLACGKCQKTPERPIRYVTCGHFFCDTCIYGESICYRCKTPVRPNEKQPYRTVAQLIEYCRIIKNVIAEIKPKDLRPLARVVKQFAAEHRGVVPETDSESDNEVVQSTPPVQQNEKNQNLLPETAGFVGPTQLNQTRKKKLEEQETVGFVDPTPMTQTRKKKLEEPETAGFVDPTQMTQTRKKKVEEPETAGFVDPTQMTETRKKKLEEPETAGFVAPTQFRPHENKRTSTKKKDFGDETAGYVDPSQMDKSHTEENFEPETAGYVDPTQTPRRHWKKNVQARTSDVDRLCDNRDHHKENNSPPESASYIDPTPINRPCRKIDLHAEISGCIDQIQTSLNHEKKAVETQSDEFNVPTNDQKGSKIDLQAEFAGFVDSPPKSQHSKKNEIEMKSAQFINPTLENKCKKINNSQLDSVDYVEQNKVITKKFHDEMDSLKNSAAQNNVFVKESRKDLVLAPESIRMEENSSSRIVIPETLDIVENTQDRQDSAMEIDAKHNEIPLKKNTHISVKSNDDNDKLTISNSKEIPMESAEVRKETPLKQLKRIKNFALEHRSKIRKNSLDISNNDNEQTFPMEITEMRQLTVKKQTKIDEKLTQERREKISSISSDTMAIANVGNLNEQTTEIIEKTSKLRRFMNDSMAERQKNHSTINTKKKSPRSLEIEEKASTKLLSRIKDFTNECQKKNSSINDEILGNIIASDTPAKNSEIREKDSLKQLRSLKNFKQEDKTSENNCKDKLVKLKSRRSIGEKSNSTIPKAIPKNLNKRNAKGETALHTACVKGQDDYVKALLEAGANPNTKDNANWTPLQEATNLGHREICKMLLQAGASANTPAMDNRTALHDAAANDKFDEASLLLRFNANKDVYDKFGNRPIDYAVSDEMRFLLSDENNVEKIVDDITQVNTTLEQSIIIPNAKIIVLPSDLSDENRKLLAQLAFKLKVEVATLFRPSVTHVIVEANERNITKLTYPVMLAILQGKWILNSQWITISKDLNDISEIDLALFEVHGAPNPETPARARTNEEKQNPRLFNNCFFYFAIGPRGTWNYEKFKFSKENLMALVIAGQGEILNREPDPEDVKDCKLKPFHVAHKPIHPLHKCSHYIIYMPGKDEPRIKYNMPHIKTLPLGWFLECIEKFSLVDPSLMGIS